MEHESVQEPDSWHDLGDVPRDVVLGLMEGEDQSNLLGQEIHRGGSLEVASPQHSEDGSKQVVGG